MVEVDHPRRYVIEASGDLAGRGIWTLEPAGSAVHLTYDWRVRAAIPAPGWLTPLLKPVFVWNHDWAMARGEAGLRRELDRIRASGRRRR